MEKQDHHHKELQLLPPASAAAAWLLPPPAEPSTSRHLIHSPEPEPEEVDLQLSISILPNNNNNNTAAAAAAFAPNPPTPPQPDRRQVEAMRWQAAEQIRMAALEKAYAERVRELTRREMEQAQAELSGARMVWERARDDVARAELLKQNAQVGCSASPMEITCHSCRHRFRP